ncbi:chemotaxis protein CheW [Crenalkalicoccus roseus]|uniref:chemotaxis protein CheW n=1 Tax=Crenalkalicoccus roseus TaxID=1485588 RepID=UPI001081A7EE|nr:chemotaxis protein CheW [Crenalkalicoccus roseus]
MAGEREAARARRILEARAAQLAARRGSTAEEAAPRARLLACAVGAELCGIALDALAEVLPARPWVPVAGAAPPVLGAIGLAGRLCSVVDLATALGLAAEAPSPARGHLLRLRRPARIALRVERALAVVEAEPLPDARAGGVGGAAVVGYARAPAGSLGPGEALLGLIDPEALLRPLLSPASASGA